MAINSFITNLNTIVCPTDLLELAKNVKVKPRVAIADAANKIVMLSAKMGCDKKIIPVDRKIPSKNRITSHDC